MNEFKPSVQPGTSSSPLQALYGAIDDALTAGIVTWVKDRAGAPIAAIVPRGIAEVGISAWDKEVNHGTSKPHD